MKKKARGRREGGVGKGCFAAVTLPLPQLAQTP